MLENSWFNYIGDQRKSSKNETPKVVPCKNYIIRMSSKLTKIYKKKKVRKKIIVLYL